MGLLITYMAVALGISFLCSLLEATLLAVPASHVGALAERGHAGARRLQALKQDIDRPLAAILTLNTVAHTIGAAGVGAQAVTLWGDKWLGLVSAAMTIAILLLSEIIPKTLGAVHARHLVTFTAWSIAAMIVLLYPLVRICEWLSRLFSRTGDTDGPSRDEVRSVAKMGEDTGALSDKESRIIGNLLSLREMRVEDIMTPRLVLFMLQADTTVGNLIADGPPLRFARIPVYGENQDDVLGIVLRYSIFEAHGKKQLDTRIRDLVKPIRAIPGSAAVSTALDQFIRRNEHILLVVDEWGGTEGVVTLEDTLETLLGEEIVDETDTSVDMRQLAEWQRFRKFGRK